MNKGIDSNKVIDMATTLKNLTHFTGEDKEKIEVCIRDIKLIANVSKWTEEDTKRAMILSSKGKALSWAFQVLDRDKGLKILEQKTMPVEITSIYGNINLLYKGNR